MEDKGHTIRRELHIKLDTVADSNRLQALYVHANARAKLRFVMARDPLDPPPGAPATPPEAHPETPSPDAGTHP